MSRSKSGSKHLMKTPDTLCITVLPTPPASVRDRAIDVAAAAQMSEKSRAEWASAADEVNARRRDR
jgi:hypothetical protein